MAVLAQHTVSIVCILLWASGVETLDPGAVSPAGCVIPPGEYNYYPVASFDDEPTSGSLCKYDVTLPVQRIVKACMPRWCCSTTCNCANATEKSSKGMNCTQILCYVEQRINSNYSYRCCPGYTRVDHTCLSNDSCRGNSLGCQYNCNTSSNGLSRCTCPSGFQLNPIDNRTCQDINECLLTPSPCEDTCSNTNGSYICSCGMGKQLASDGHSCIVVPAPIVPGNKAPNPLPVNEEDPSITTSTSGSSASFPFQYIIAAVVGSVVFLLLLLFITLCLVCRSRQKPSVQVFFIGKKAEADKKVEFDPYEKPVISLYDEKKLYSDYSSLDNWKDVPSNDKMVDKDSNDNDTRAPPNIYSEMTCGLPAVPPKKLPVIKPTDLNSDYAEIDDKGTC